MQLYDVHPPHRGGSLVGSIVRLACFVLGPEDLSALGSPLLCALFHVALAALVGGGRERLGQAADRGPTKTARTGPELGKHAFTYQLANSSPQR
ncbi:uncharacterized protein N7482_007775 [Penicillium canariense]|uniref:Uncharacterized protein n=1 Tax=Penicillium canariense TaxID=189055 RepID=A0A9W9LKX0_9EURO|nr:uncharacterized protein N7482_007775 [Penicillium canariense]KAJ5160771.1 hypothetical protein N7482_007775 [Penicillium canariense]